LLLCTLQQAALLHNRDLFGTGYADSFTRAMTDSGLQYKAISLGAIITEESVRTAILDLKQSGIKVLKQSPVLCIIY
jgi:ABC-type branched-subunit amino acid transport system substrate-binding protein